MSQKFSLVFTSLLLVLFGAGCVDVRVISQDADHLPVVGRTDFVSDSRMSVGRRKTLGDHEYVVFTLKKGSARLFVSRPNVEDANIFLSVAGTYTNPNGDPEGFVVVDGKILQSRERQGWNGAAFFRADGTVNIFETNNGKLLTRDYLKTVERDGASLVQGHLLVHNGAAQSLLPQTPYQRRALVLFSDHSVGVVESVDLLDLASFAADMVELGVTEAMNLDMGQWSEGWYRDPSTSRRTSIGYLFGATDKQSNWIVFTER